MFRDKMFTFHATADDHHVDVACNNTQWLRSRLWNSHFRYFLVIKVISLHTFRFSFHDYTYNTTHCVIFLVVANRKQDSSLSISKLWNLVYRLVCRAEYKFSETYPGPVIESDPSNRQSWEFTYKTFHAG